MFNFLILVLSVYSFALVISADVPSLPYCSDDSGSGLVIVSTLDGKLSALNYSGSLAWQIETGPGPLLLSNIHTLELTNNGEWVRIIPSLTGTLYKFDGTTVDPIPISAEELLKSSFRYSDDLVIAGGIEIRTYGIGFRTGTVYYECTSLKCSNNDRQDVDDLVLIERSTHTVRAVEPRTGNERWNFSVGLHNVKLHRVSCINDNVRLFDWNLTTVVPEGKLKANITHNGVEEHSWQYIFSSPIVRIWKWSGKELSEVNLFLPTNFPQVVSNIVQPSLYIGMHHKQLYIYESMAMQHILYRKPHYNISVAETKSIAKIPWKPVSASTQSTEDDSTALSVLNESEYVNGKILILPRGHGFYLYTESDLKNRDTPLCESNRSFVGKTIRENIKADIFHTYLLLWWKEIIIMSVTFFIGHILFRFWHDNYKTQEIIIIEKPVDAVISTERRVSERDNESFSSRYMNDFDTVQCLGRGGFGVVFQVKQKIDMCHYAIKRITLPNELSSRDRVMREVIALAKLDHPNIVRYFNSWVEHPPMGWQEEYDPKLMGDRSLFSDEGSDITTTGSVKRSKSISVNINTDCLCKENHSEISRKENGVEDDSFIVFQDSGTEMSSTKSNIPEPSSDLSNSILNKTSTMSDHMRKKIDWKRPSRRHHSWDLSNNSSSNFVNPPVFLYIQMQLCKKESLKEWLARNKEREYNFVLDIFNQILNAVQYVHLRGLIHRDLKPGNILFSLDDTIKIGDFGLVKDMEDALDLELLKKGVPVPYNGHTVEVGTQLYMSPEQFHSRIYDYKVDIYSLGLIFFELLTPFNTEMERIQTLTNVKKNIYPDGFVQKFPEVHILLQSMLCEDPNKRLTTIGIRARPPFNHQDSGFSEECHYRLNNFQKT